MHGKLEVDLVLGDSEVAIEIKATQNAITRHAKGLKSFAEEYSVKKLLLITNDPFPRQMGEVLVLPWQVFLKSLWAGEIIT